MTAQGSSFKGGFAGEAKADLEDVEVEGAVTAAEGEQLGAVHLAPKVRAVRDPEKETIVSVVAELGAGGPEWSAISEALGLAPTDEVDVLLSISDARFEKALDTVTLKPATGEGDPKPLSAAQAGRAGKLRKRIRALFTPPAAPKPIMAPVAPVFRPVINVAAPVEDDQKVVYTEVLVQGLSGSCTSLSSEELQKLRVVHLELVGCHPEPGERPSDDQLSALSSWLKYKKGGAPPGTLRRLRHLGAIREDISKAARLHNTGADPERGVDSQASAGPGNLRRVVSVLGRVPHGHADVSRGPAV